MICLMCKKDNVVFMGQKNNAFVFRCLECNLLYRDLVLIYEYEQQYKTGYYSDKLQEEIGAIPYKDRLEHDLEVARLRIIDIEETIGDIGGQKILDVGIGNGAFLDKCGEKKCRAYGVECDFELASFVQEKEKQPEGLFKSLKDVDEYYFDLVTFFDSLEHFVDPLGALMDARKLLRYGGKLIIEQPDPSVCNGIGWKHLRPEQHLFLFSLENFKMLFEKAGLEIVHQKQFREDRLQVIGRKK